MKQPVIRVAAETPIKKALEVGGGACAPLASCRFFRPDPKQPFPPPLQIMFSGGSKQPSPPPPSADSSDPAGPAGGRL